MSSFQLVLRVAISHYRQLAVCLQATKTQMSVVIAQQLTSIIVYLILSAGILKCRCCGFSRFGCFVMSH